MLEPQDVERYVRELRAMLRKAGDEDPEGFAMVVRLLDAARASLPLAAEIARSRQGYSYADFGRALGITRQSAAERFTPRHVHRVALQSTSTHRGDAAYAIVRHLIAPSVAYGDRVVPA